MLDFVIELVGEVFLEGYVYLCIAFIPEENISPRVYVVIKIIVTVLAIIMFFASILSIGYLIKSKGMLIWPWCVIAFNALYVILGVILKRKKNRS